MTTTISETKNIFGLQNKSLDNFHINYLKFRTNHNREFYKAYIIPSNVDTDYQSKSFQNTHLSVNVDIVHRRSIFSVTIQFRLCLYGNVSWCVRNPID